MLVILEWFVPESTASVIDYGNISSDMAENVGVVAQQAVSAASQSRLCFV